MTSIDWGNVPSWISALGSVAALGTASWAARAAWRQVKFSADQQRHRDEQVERDQATKFAAWLIAKADTEGRPQIYVRYANMSELPVFDLSIIPVYYPDCRLNIGIIEPTNEVRDHYAEALTQRIQRRYDELCGTLSQIFDEGNLDAAENDPAKPAFSTSILQINPTLFRFRDTQNITWRRDSDGLLRKARVDSDGDDTGDPHYSQIKETRHKLRDNGFEFESVLMNNSIHTE